jgi:hypothetical protein
MADELQGLPATTNHPSLELALKSKDTKSSERAMSCFRKKKFFVDLHSCTNFLFIYTFNVYKHGVLGSGIYENLKKA